jgi:hypothetical protein
MHLGLYELQRDQDRLLQRTATPLVERYRQHMAAPMPLIQVSASGDYEKTTSTK